MSTQPTTWDEAAEEAVRTVLGAWPPHRRGDRVAGMLRNELNGLINDSFHHDERAQDYVNSMACFARDALLDLEAETGDVLFSRAEIALLLATKQAAYGTDNITTFGIKGVIIRVSDKVARIENMLANGRADDDTLEPLQDAYVDIIGYAAIALMLERRWFTLPLKRDLVVDDEPVICIDPSTLLHAADRVYETKNDVSVTRRCGYAHPDGPVHLMAEEQDRVRRRATVAAAMIDGEEYWDYYARRMDETRGWN